MYPEGLYYTKDHEWVRVDGDVCTVGITEYAAEQLGDVTYVELPAPGTEVKQHGEAATVESVKAASDVYAPIAGEVSEVNDALEDTPELVNESPYEKGWFFKLTGTNASDLESLMNAEAYSKLVEEERDS